MTDTQTNLTYKQQRYYDPVAVRFLSPDPVDVSPTNGSNFNRYWYANNNPLMFVDPDGRESQYVRDNSSWLSQKDAADIDPEEFPLFDKALDQALPELFSTSKGQELKAAIQEGGGLVIRTNNDNVKNAVSGSGEINVDPLGSTTAQTTEGE